ncbi:hypothetical protein LWI28_022227 [Acer negundo]|uniref:Uncharacterized protein n=1 Tax=Acer negundo TaxID=4023 RepID=A0AAD5IGL4_ACENE|nr:hypothetical protein LWI28_022227 [Acer negundo]
MSERIRKSSDFRATINRSEFGGSSSEACSIRRTQLEYFDTIMNPYFTHDARESPKPLQGVLLEKATESVSEAVGHLR